MTDLLTKIENKCLRIIFNRIHKHNAFDDEFLVNFHTILLAGIKDPNIRVILIEARGKFFCAGADASWMQKTSQYQKDENLEDAITFAKIMHDLYLSPKPTISVIQGGAFGGGIGIIAACDIAIASIDAYFSFSEVKLGLIPAVISPYVIRAIGPRAAKWLFLSAEKFNAQRAFQLQLIHHLVPNDELTTFAFNYAKEITKNAPNALSLCKSLIEDISYKDINSNTLLLTANLIAKTRQSCEAQQGIAAFLEKKTPPW